MHLPVSSSLVPAALLAFPLIAVSGVAAGRNHTASGSPVYQYDNLTLIDGHTAFTKNGLHAQTFFSGGPTPHDQCSSGEHLGGCCDAWEADLAKVAEMANMWNAPGSYCNGSKTEGGVRKLYNIKIDAPLDSERACKLMWRTLNSDKFKPSCATVAFSCISWREKMVDWEDLHLRPRFELEHVDDDNKKEESKDGKKHHEKRGLVDHHHPFNPLNQGGRLLVNTTVARFVTSTVGCSVGHVGSAIWEATNIAGITCHKQ